MVNEETQSFLDSFLVQLYPKNTEGVQLCLVNINYIFDRLASLSNLKYKKKKNNEKEQRKVVWFRLQKHESKKSLIPKTQKSRQPRAPRQLP